jgi:predicted Ser/Thr protein kinase
VSDSRDDATKQDRPARASQPSIQAQPDFGPRYRVIGPLGKGGMGEVFHAYDTELKGEVALKVIRGDIDQDESLARFRREIALARKVTNANVLRVYDLAEHAGLRFVSMEYVEGEDLGALLKREKRLELERALALFRQVCTGLAAAHAQGVVHRDLKPQNVLVGKEDLVRVGDFGLARSISDSALTASGAVLGSPAYMSPEQIKGEPTDERSDIYSLGIMLYQLVTGQTPFQAPTPHAVMEMRLHQKPRPLRELVPEVPANVDAVCAKCLVVDAAGRFASVKELLTALDAGAAPPGARRIKMLAIGAAAVGVAAAAGIVIATRPHSHEAAPAGSAPVAKPAPQAPANAPTKVLVLGIENRSPDTALDNTLDMIVATALRQSPRLDPYAGVDLRRLAAELGTTLDDHTAERLVARDGGRVLNVRGLVTANGSKLTISLVAKDSGGGSPVYDQAMEAASIDQVVVTAARLASALRSALGETIPDSERERTGLSPSLDADREYAFGQPLVRNGDYLTAADHLERAVAIDPKFGAAHMTLSVAYTNLKRSADAAKELERARESVDQM